MHVHILLGSFTAEGISPHFFMAHVALKVVPHQQHRATVSLILIAMSDSSVSKWHIRDGDHDILYL